MNRISRRFRMESDDLSRHFRLGRRLMLGLIIVGFISQTACKPQETKLAELHPAQDPTDLAGQSFDPLHAITNKAVILLFLSVECPVCGRYAPEIRRLCDKFQPNGIKFWLVYPNADESVDAIRKSTNAYRLDCGALCDPGHFLVRKAQAKVTPTAAVFIPSGQLVYAGRIDDQQIDFGQTRQQATQRDLENVLEAILQAKPLPTEWKAANGCSIPNL
jgi:hypothetical protein